MSDEYNSPRPADPDEQSQSQHKIDPKRIRVPNPSRPSPTPTIEEGKGGEGGDDSLAKVTNSAFLSIVFSAVPEGATPLALAKPGDPAGGDWTGFDAKEAATRCRPGTNNYFNCASFHASGAGATRALEASAAAYHCLVLDDVGTKTPLDALPPVDPTWMIETSPSNFQVGFRLATPVDDFAAVKAAQKRVFGKGLGDRGAGGVGRWVRLPDGINGKSKYKGADGRPFQCRLAEWNPGVSYELDDLVERLAPREVYPQAEEGNAVAVGRPLSASTHPSISSDVFRPASSENPVVGALKAAGLYKRETAPGRHDITCPWVDEHTDQIDDGACFFEPSHDHPLGGFKCHHSHGDRYGLKALLDRFGLTRRDVHNKPCIRIVDGELKAMVDAAQVVLADTGEFFQSGGLIVKVSVDASSGRASLVPQTDADLTLALSSAADWERCETKDGVSVWRRCNPLPNCVRLLAQTQSYALLPALRGIARQPTFDEGTRLIAASGYDQQSKLYCAFDASRFVRPDATEENARAALERLVHLLREFRFATSRDRAATLCAILTAVLRPGLGRAPAFHVRAPSPGTGKSLLADVIARFAGPGEPAKVSYPRTDEEATKVILAALLQAPAVLDFDDMTTDWRPFGAINRLLTSSTMTDRILGASKMGTVSTDTLVLGSGNNTGPTGDLNRRVVVIDLDAREESPATLRYEGDPLREIETKREAYVADVLLIVEAWIAAGMPRADLSPIATYGGRWTDFCRETVVWLGLEDPALGLIEQLRDDPERATLGRFLRAWHAGVGEKAVTLRALLADADGELVEAIEDLPFVDGAAINRTRFGYYLKRNAGRPVGGLKLEKADSRERNAWRVVRFGEQEENGSLQPPTPPSPPSPPSDRPGEGASTPIPRKFRQSP